MEFFFDRQVHYISDDGIVVFTKPLLLLHNSVITLLGAAKTMKPTMKLSLVSHSAMSL